MMNFAVEDLFIIVCLKIYIHNYLATFIHTRQVMAVIHLTIGSVDPLLCRAKYDNAVPLIKNLSLTAAP